MNELKFLHPVFIHHGENTTVRRGIKWDIHGGETVKVSYPDGVSVEVPIKTEVKRFCDLTTYDIALQHDEETRNLPGLFGAMRRAYPDFDRYEIVTIVHFDMP